MVEVKEIIDGFGVLSRLADRVLQENRYIKSIRFPTTRIYKSVSGLELYGDLTLSLKYFLQQLLENFKLADSTKKIDEKIRILQSIFLDLQKMRAKFLEVESIIDILKDLEEAFEDLGQLTVSDSDLSGKITTLRSGIAKIIVELEDSLNTGSVDVSMKNDAQRLLKLYKIIKSEYEMKILGKKDKTPQVPIAMPTQYTYLTVEKLSIIEKIVDSLLTCNSAQSVGNLAVWAPDSIVSNNFLTGRNILPLSRLNPSGSDISLHLLQNFELTVTLSNIVDSHFIIDDTKDNLRGINILSNFLRNNNSIYARIFYVVPDMHYDKAFLLLSNMLLTIPHSCSIILLKYANIDEFTYKVKSTQGINCLKLLEDTGIKMG